jgi:hypothetical protein
MPPTGGYRTSLSWQARYGPLGQSVTDAVFSPGQPLNPPDQEPVRVWDFPVGVNALITPRSSEAFGFAHLRAFSNVELVRLAIETRKGQLDALQWRFNPRDDIPTPSDAQARAQRLTQFWRRPDGVHAFAPWLRLATEDLLAIDAPAFEKRRDRAGRLIGLDVVPGDTIKLLVDETGRTPVPPAPAFQQIIKGRVWADLTTDDLLYAPRNRRPNHVLGFSPVEQIVVTIQTIINRQAAQLAYFTERQAAASQTIAVADQAAQDRVRTITRTLIEEVPAHVSATTDVRFPLPLGFVRLHDAAVAGDDLSAAAPGSVGPDDAASGVAASAAAAVIVGNYGSCHADQARLAELQAWARSVGLAK